MSTAFVLEISSALVGVRAIVGEAVQSSVGWQVDDRAPSPWFG